MGAIAFSRGQRAFFDSNALIYWVEDVQPYSRILDPLTEAAARGDLTIAVSSLSLLEALVAPLRRRDTRLARRFREVLDALPGLERLAITDEILERAAQLRAESGLRTPDAIIVATYLLAECGLFVTNDSRLKPIVGDATVLLSELA